MINIINSSQGYGRLIKGSVWHYIIVNETRYSPREVVLVGLKKVGDYLGIPTSILGDNICEGYLPLESKLLEIEWNSVIDSVNILDIINRDKRFFLTSLQISNRTFARPKNKVITSSEINLINSCHIRSNSNYNESSHVDDSVSIFKLNENYIFELPAHNKSKIFNRNELSNSIALLQESTDGSENKIIESSFNSRNLVIEQLSIALTAALQNQLPTSRIY